MILWPVKEIVTSHLVWFMGTDMPATMCAHWMGVIKTKPKGEKMPETIIWLLLLDSKAKFGLENTFRESRRNYLPSL